MARQIHFQKVIQIEEIDIIFHTKKDWNMTTIIYVKDKHATDRSCVSIIRAQKSSHVQI